LIKDKEAELIKYLDTSRRIDLGVRDKTGTTLLIIAVKQGKKELVEAILRHAPDDGLDTPDDRRWTPVQHCLCEGHYDILDLLLKKGAKVNVANDDGYTFVHLLCKLEDESIARRILAEHHSTFEFEPICKKGETPVDLASVSLRRVLAEYTSILPVDSIQENMDKLDLRPSLYNMANNKDLKPILLVPGICSSALEIWTSPWTSEDSAWQRELLWVCPSKMLSRNFFMQHMRLRDGWKDPLNIKVRPVEGLSGIDYLSRTPIVGVKSVVWDVLIRHLGKRGYDNKNLKACTYDWRIPPSKLEERDRQFTIMRLQIETLTEMNGKKVVLIAHSMGNLMCTYFLRWIKRLRGVEWIEKHIEDFISVAAPWLGSPQTVRAAVTGERFGLPAALMAEDMAREIGRNFGSVPWLFPERKHKFTLVDERGTKKVDAVELLQKTDSLDTLRFLREYYEKDELLYNQSTKERIVTMPPVTRMLCIYGIDVKTEISSTFSPKGTAPISTEYEISSGQHHSGDGTVHYASLSHSKSWNSRAVQTEEIVGAKHREILQEKKFFDIIDSRLFPE